MVLLLATTVQDFPLSCDILLKIWPLQVRSFEYFIFVHKAVLAQCNFTLSFLFPKGFLWAYITMLTQPRRTACPCLCLVVLQPHLIMASWVRDVTSLNQIKELFFLHGVSVALPWSPWVFFTLWEDSQHAGCAPNSACPEGFYMGNERWPFLFHLA